MNVDYIATYKERRARMGMAPKINFVTIKRPEIAKTEEVKEIPIKAPIEPEIVIIPINRSKKPSYGRITLSKILTEVSFEFGVSKNDLLSCRRTMDIVIVRHAFCYLAKELTTCSYPQIGKFINRDHTTAINAVNKAKNLILDHVDFAESIKTIIERLTNNVSSEYYWGA